MGVDHGIAKLGSIDFLTTSSVETQMALDYSHTETIRTGAGFSQITNAELPDLDLCVMNPPFVRSVGGNLLFGSLPDERGQLQKELKHRIKKVAASATAGMDSVFVALADRHLKVGGRLSLVLKASVLSGEAWAKTRALVSQGYNLEIVVSSQDAERFNFSENTDLTEVLVVARKRAENEAAGRTTYINLWRNPRSIHEAIDLANRIAQTKDVVSIEGEGVTTVSGTSGKLAEVVSFPAHSGKQNWYGALFAQTELIRSYRMLESGKLRVPGAGEPSDIKLCQLDTLADLGPDRARIHEGFSVTKTDRTPYPALWGHDSDKVRAIAQLPNSNLVVRQDSPRGEGYGPHLWERAGRILLVERLWPITHRVLAVALDKPTFGNTWWSVKTKNLTSEQEDALVFWLNSSLGLLLYFGRRVVTRSAWMQMKQPAWQSMPVLDVHALTRNQLRTLSDAYHRLKHDELKPLAQLISDKVRSDIDAVVNQTLRVPDLGPIRELLSREPGWTGHSIGKRASQVELPIPVEITDEEEDTLDLS
jgi:hypothetical protein